MNQVIYCPICHQRLFDADTSSHGRIEIKCPRCRQLQRINLCLPDYAEKLNRKYTT